VPRIGHKEGGRKVKSRAKEIEARQRQKAWGERKEGKKKERDGFSVELVKPRGGKKKKKNRLGKLFLKEKKRGDAVDGDFLGGVIEILRRGERGGGRGKTGFSWSINKRGRRTHKSSVCR